MPRANWGKEAPSKKDIDNYDRSSQRYMGPTPSNGSYRGDIKVLQQVIQKGKKKPQLRAGMELVPRNKAEKKFKGYFIMDFMPIAKGTEFRYVPFLDAIGVSADDFLEKTKVDEDGNILKIGKWVKKNASQIVFAIANNTGEQADLYPKQVSGYAPLNEDDADDSDSSFADDEDEDEDWDDESDDDESDDDEEEDEEEDEEPEPPRRKKSKRK